MPDIGVVDVATGNSMDEVTIFLAVLLLLLICYALYLSPWWLRWLWPRVRYCFAKKQTQRARIVAMREKYPLNLRDGGWLQTRDEEIFHTHYAILRLEDGELHTMRIIKADYQGLLTGAEGMLLHKGNWFLSFKTDK